MLYFCCAVWKVSGIPGLAPGPIWTCQDVLQAEPGLLVVIAEPVNQSVYHQLGKSLRFQFHPG